MSFKRIISLMMSICLIMSLFIGVTGTANAEDNVITHTVKSGEYLFKICKSYNLDYYQCKNAIMALNGFTDETQMNRLSVGQKIKLPASNALASTVTASTTTTTTVSTSTTIGGTTTTTSSTTTTAGAPVPSASTNAAFFLVPYVVKSGDTLNNICNALGTSYYTYSSMILAMNGLANAASLIAGKTIYIPVNAIPQSGGSYYSVVYHTVKSNETMTSICSAYGISYANNSKLINGLNSGKNLNKLLVGDAVYIPVAGTAPTGSTGTTTSTTTTVPPISTTPAPTATSYEINMGEVYGVGFHGYPYATVNGANVSKAVAGTTVTIHGNADNGYSLKSIEVVRLDSLATIPTSGNTFTMPSSAVKVSVNYEAGYKLTKAPTANGTIDLYVNGAIADHALAGDKITIVANPNFTYVATSAKYNGTSAKRDSLNNYSFTMPAMDTTVVVTFDVAASYTIKTEKSRTYDTVQYGTVEYTVDGTPAEKVAEGAVVTMNFSLPVNVIVKTIEIVKDGGGTVSFKRIEGQPKWYFTMPKDNVTVKVKYAGAGTYSINTIPVSDKEGATGNVLYQVDGKTQSTASAGQTVKVVVNPLGKSKLNNILIRFTDGTTNVVTSIDASGMYVFKMPESSVNVYVHFGLDGTQNYSVYNIGSVPLSFVLEPSGEHTASYKAGETCSIIPDYNKYNYKVTGVYWRDKDGNDHKITENPAGSGKYPFTVPAYDVSVYAKIQYFETWAQINFVSVPGVVELYVYDDNGNPIVSGTSVKSGSTITIQAIVEEGHTLNSITKTGGVNEMKGSGKTRTYTVSAKDDGTTITFTATGS